MQNSRQTSSQKRNVLFMVIVLLAATIYYFFVAQGSPSLHFSAENRTFSFDGLKNTSVLFSFDTLQSLQYYEGDAPDYGTPLDGEEMLGGYHYGTWKSDSLGEYQAFISTRIPAYIIASDAEKTAIFNTSNAETTQSLYSQLLAFWEAAMK